MIPKITVIMPAYNAAKTIERSVHSILRQTYPSLELIVVNDGSTDTTLDLLKAIAQTDERLHILTVPNGGPAKARNHGLAAANRETSFIMFCDADDEYLPDTVERAIQAGGDADILLFGFTIVNPDGTRNHYCEPSGQYTGATLGPVLPDLYKANLLNQVWAKLFRADIIFKNEIEFPDYRWGEDRLFVFACLERAERISVLEDCMYLYIMQEGESLISGYYEKKPEVCVRIDRRMRELCAKFGVRDDSYIRYMFVKSIFSCISNLYAPSCRLSQDEKREYVSRILNNEYIVERCSNVGGGIPVKAVSKVLCSGDVTLSLLAARAAVVMGKKLPKLFQKIKHKK